MSQRADYDFEVFVSDYSSSVDEYRRAMSAAKSELPELTAQQRLVAKKMGISEEDYKRGVMAGRLGESRMLSRGRELGKAVQKLLVGLGPDFRVNAIKAEMFNDRWLVRVVAPEKIYNVAISRELADDVLDSGAVEEIERLKNCLLKGLERSELIARS